jgi:acetoin utilization protein AcuB
MTLDTIMTRNVVTVGMDDSLERVRNLFGRLRIHHLMVLEKCKVVGIISDRDVLTHLSPFAGKSLERSLDAACLKKRAHQIMTRRVISASPRTPIHEAAIVMLNRGISCLPVMDDRDKCLGIVTWRDVLHWTLNHLTPDAMPACAETCATDAGTIGTDPAKEAA